MYVRRALEVRDVQSKCRNEIDVVSRQRSRVNISKRPNTRRKSFLHEAEDYANYPHDCSETAAAETPLQNAMPFSTCSSWKQPQKTQWRNTEEKNDGGILERKSAIVWMGQRLTRLPIKTY
ncbi:hypothetical protein P3T76_006933 [Phytophthora citrophthora]|uniref:Uncharacterized protein n=1 Tax=Phytophthora citrophthora TaxID=4793 RepID=A0AAD9GNW5_9STRA|nr:hypothetical protein P3T76_006933 [Phytophthora citrophthora]